MRYGVGLIGLLVTVAIMLWIFKEYEAPVIQKGEEAKAQARQYAGRDRNGDNATDAVTLDVHQRGGRSDGGAGRTSRGSNGAQTVRLLQSRKAGESFHERTGRLNFRQPD